MGKNVLLVTLALLVLTPVLANATTGPVGWWKMDETSGTIVADSSPNRNHGAAVNGPTWVTAGQIGGALRFDGSNDYVELPIGQLISTLSSSSFTIWANFTSGGSWVRLFDFGTGATVNMFLTPAQGTAGAMRFAITTAGNGAESQLTASAMLASGWHHVAVTIDGTTRQMVMYLDGVQVATNNATNTLPMNLGVTTNNWLGRSQYGADGYYNGMLDDFRIYDRVVTVTDLPGIMAGGGNYATASSPVPESGATDVLRETSLSWVGGQYAAKHDVYLGTSRDDVVNASRTNPLGVLVKKDNDVNSYDPPGRFDLGATYYWRIDEVNAAPSTAVFKGDLWSFTVEPFSYPITDVNATASSFSKAGLEPSKTVGGIGLNPNDQHSTVSEDMWLSGPGYPQWIQYAFDKVYKLDKMWVWNSNQVLESLFGFGAKDVLVQYSTDGATWTDLGNFVFNQAPGSPDYIANTDISFGGVAAKYVKLTISSSWGGILPGVGLSEVRFYFEPVAAREPSPAADATNVHPEVIFQWRAGREAASHDLYVSTDPNAVADDTAPKTTVSQPKYEAALDLEKTYYWKVVEVNQAETPSAWASDVWSFTAATYITVDDFESYGNDSPKRVFQTWIDGSGFSADEFFPNGAPGNGTGALVGYDPLAGDVMQRSIVYGGLQSMPLYYDNSVAPKISEAIRTFATAQDWTKHSITTLTLWFRGDPNNSGAPIYVKINNTKKVYNNGAASTTTAIWKTWDIDLASVPAADLKAVKTLTIGVGDGSTGGTGTIFIDEIRLYATAPKVVTPTDPGTNGLQLLYAMEGDVKDTSGHNLNGTANGDPGYVNSVAGMGKALAFDGVNDYVDVPIGTLLSTLTSSSFTAWADLSAGAAWQRVFDFGTGTTIYMFLTINSGASGGPRFAITTTGNGSVNGVPNESLATAPWPIAPGWHHLASVIDATAMTITLYLDGVPVQTNAARKLPRDMGVTTQNWLGRSQWAADAYYNGLMDDFRIYNRALSEAEVRYLAGER
jgi:hypothetical protein